VDLLTLFGMAFGMAFSGAVMPGPVLFSTIRWSAQYGRWVGVLIVVGHALVEIPLMIAIILGLGQWLDNATARGVIGIAGLVMLGAMGLLMLRSLPRQKLPDPNEARAAATPSGVGKVILSGAVTSVSNPYFPGWWATVGLNFIVHAKPFGIAGYAVFYIGHILGDLVWYAAVAESMQRGRRLLSDRGYRRLIGACAVLLIGFAFFFGWAGVRALTT
jgi:threonine/homoserine/homoserine lactone efflux protein